MRALANHVTRGNLNYIALLQGGTAADFLRMRDADAMGSDPVDAFIRSAGSCAAAFAEPGALQRHLDYPLGRASGQQLLAVRTVDSLVHTWDLARAMNADEILDHTLVDWAGVNLRDIYWGLRETPTAADTTHRFFAAAASAPGDASTQDRLLIRMGRIPHAPAY